MFVVVYKELYVCCWRDKPKSSSPLPSSYYKSHLMDPAGTIVFSTVGRTSYGFDIFCVRLSPDSDPSSTEQRLTDGLSVNFNGNFVDEDRTIVYISERTGASHIFFNRHGNAPKQLDCSPQSLFHDRPVINKECLYFISAHQQPEKPFRSWCALYSAGLHDKGETVRLTPHGSVDYSPAISKSGSLIAVASYGPRPWAGEFHDLQTDIVVFQESDPTRRILVCQHGGWPTWSGDSVLYFHRQADDGWWAIFRVELPEDFLSTGAALAPVRVTPPGLHCFTPAAMHDRNIIAVATRRKGMGFRHIEILDVDTQKFSPVTELHNPDFHHYSPFISPESTFLGYHRFRGKGADGESTISHLEPITSPIPNLGLLRINGNFPAFSPSGDLIAFNHDFEQNPGLKIVKSNGSRRWTLLKDRVSFHNSWSPADNNVIFTSIGPIFQSARRTVQIARLTFDPDHLYVSDEHEEIPVDVKILTEENTGNNAFPSSSPDGKSVVFRSGRSGHKNLYIVDAINGEFDGGIRRLTEGEWIDTMPSWSPDGKLIAFSSNRHNPDDDSAFGIYLIGSDGTGLRRLPLAGIESDKERLNHVCFSGDGDWLLFTSNLGGVTADPVSLPNQFQPYGDLYVVRLDGCDLRRLTCNPYENGTPAWHPRSLSGTTQRDEVGEDELKGQFVEPLWIRCDV